MSGAPVDGRGTYVLDTSVLLSDPMAFSRFGRHDVIIPVVVLDELEGKRHHPELGWAARTTLRALEEMRLHHGDLQNPMATNEDGGTVRVELNHRDLSHLPESLQGISNDHRILGVASSLAAAGFAVTLVSKDLPLRLRASMAGVGADDYHPVGGNSDHLTGFESLTVDGNLIDDLYRDGIVDLDEARDLPCHTGLALTNGSQSVLARVHPDKRVRRVDADMELFGVRGRNAEQKLALDLLADPTIGVVSLGGPARSCPYRPAWSRWWRGASTVGSWCSDRCSRWAARTSGTCPDPSRRRCRRGRPPWSTPWKPSPNATWWRSSWTRESSRRSPSPTYVVGPSPTRGW